MSERNLKQVDILQKAQPYCKKYDVKLNKNDLSQYVSGKVEPGQHKLCILGLALNVSEAWLMGYDVPMERLPFSGVLSNTTEESVLNDNNEEFVDHLTIGTEKSPSPTLTDDEQEILSIFRKLTDKQKYKLIGRAEQLAEMNDTADEFLQEDIG
jgi:hypothetical protein